jgi:hypothetical protein
VWKHVGEADGHLDILIWTDVASGKRRQDPCLWPTPNAFTSRMSSVTGRTLKGLNGLLRERPTSHLTCFLSVNIRSLDFSSAQHTPLFGLDCFLTAFQIWKDALQGRSAGTAPPQALQTLRCSVQVRVSGCSGTCQLFLISNIQR